MWLDPYLDRKLSPRAVGRDENSRGQPEGRRDIGRQRLFVRLRRSRASRSRPRRPISMTIYRARRMGWGRECPNRATGVNDIQRERAAHNGTNVTNAGEEEGGDVVAAAPLLAVFIGQGGKKE